VSAVTIVELLAGAELTRKSNPAEAAEIESCLMVTERTFPLIPWNGPVSASGRGSRQGNLRS